MTVLTPPGRYHDGPVWIRVETALARTWRPPVDYEVELNDWRCRWDPRFDYVEIENTFSAFIYLERMITQGMPRAALAVVRLVDAQVAP